ncbi:MAG: hypothetical protein V1792_12890 [Pseudomonadota bacterium]
MMTTFVDDLQVPVAALLDRFFAQDHLVVTITYRLYKGRDAFGEDSFNDFPLTVIPSKKRSRNAYGALSLPIQTAHRSFIVRDVDLPAAVAIDDLSTNDRIILADGPEELVVAEIDKTLGFVAEVIAEGA